MPNKKLSFRQTIGRAIAGPIQKSFVPALDPFDGDLFGGSARSNEYKSKPDQMSANVGWSFAANGAIAQPASRVKFKLYQRMADGEREEIFEHEILDLLDNPNMAHTGEQLRALHYTYMNFTGESYILMTDASGPFIPRKGKLPLALQILESHSVTFKMEPAFLDSYIKINNQEFPIQSVIRDLNPNPVRPYDGMSVVEAAALTIDLDRKMNQWNSNLIDNGAKPSLIFSSNEPMDDAAYSRWQKQFQDERTGALNAGKPLLIEGGDAKPWMMTPSDLDFLGSRNFSRDEILAMWRVPGAVLGLTADFNRANMDAAFYINTTVNVVPRVHQFVQQLNQTLVRPYDPTLELDFESPIPEDRELKLKEATTGVNKIWTIDEVRAMYNDEPLPEGLGAQMYVPSMTVSLDSLADLAAASEGTGNADADADNEDAGNAKSLSGVKKNN
jgi:HK97 family phage portal protein